MQSYKIDLGEVTEDKVQTIRFFLYYIDKRTNNHAYMAFDFELSKALTISELLDKSVVDNVDLTYENVLPKYSYIYNPQKQGDKDEFIKAVAAKLDPDFTVDDDTILLYTETHGMTTRKFQTVLINDYGIREFNVNVPQTVNDDELVDAVDSLIEGSFDSVDFGEYQLDVDLTAVGEEA